MFVAFAVVSVEPHPRSGQELALAHEIFLRRRTENARAVELGSTRKVYCFLRLVRRLFALTGQKAAAWARSGNFCADAARLDTTLKREHEYDI